MGRRMSTQWYVNAHTYLYAAYTQVSCSRRRSFIASNREPRVFSRGVGARTCVHTFVGLRTVKPRTPSVLCLFSPIDVDQTIQRVLTTPRCTNRWSSLEEDLIVRVVVHHTQQPFVIVEVRYE